ncbi:hypothetical protein IJF86_01825 [Candidatus Saccharibacteria bacterium]|nr:hypothetical protein [Candidatus Saccharibacteria bacterium]
MQNIEVEVSGPLTAEKNAELDAFFRENGKKTNTKHRVLIDYSTFLGDGVRNREKDIRLRVTNGNPEIIVKLGAWNSNNHRKELSVFTEAGSFDRLVQIYAALGYEKGMLCERITQVYEYEGIEFALVEVPGHSFHFEAEIMSNESEVASAKKHIETICEKLELKIFTDEEYISYIEKLNAEANEVFEFKNYTENYFENRYHFSKEKAAN